MSSYEATCCSQADMQLVVPNIDEYDTKRVLPANWVDSGTSNLYHLHNAGFIDQLFKDGAEQTKVTDTPNANNEYAYESASDLLLFFMGGLSVSSMNSTIFEGGRDFTDLITECRKRGSDMVRSFCSKPIYPRKGVGSQSSVGNDFPEIVVMSAAHLACYFLIAPYNKTLADELMSRVTNEENNGWLDKIRNGEINLYQEDATDAQKGILREVSLNASTTGSIVAVRGIPTAEWDAIKILITTAGTFTAGSASSVKFTSYISNDTSTKIEVSANAEIMDGGYQDVGHGMYVRFSPGVYTINDEWELEISGIVDTSTMAVKSSVANRIG